MGMMLFLQNKPGKAMLFDSPISGHSTATPSPTEIPTTTPTPTPFVIPAPPRSPENVQPLVLSDAIFRINLRKEEQASLLAQGLPIPIVRKISVPNDFKVPAQGVQNQVSKTAVGNGWSQVYQTDFEDDFLHDGGACQWKRVSLNPNQYHLWGRDTRRFSSQNHAIWPAAYPPPPPQNVPEGTHTQLFCRLDNIGEYENLLVEFQAWFEFYSPGDWLELLFSTDGTHFRGLQWRGSNGMVRQDWRKYRIYYPQLSLGHEDTVYILWEFNSYSGLAQGSWIDDLKIERYDQPNHTCQNLNPTMEVPGVPGNYPVSKGLNVDIDTEDNVADRVQRLHHSQVQWVRLEFKATEENRDVSYPGIRSPLFPTIDLQKYDQLIDALCARNIAVLGLIDAASIRSHDWQDSGRLSYIDKREFATVADMLTHYYDDRIRYWEIWNEPDFSGSRLLPDEYASLLDATYQIIKGVDRTDKIVFGGLGGADATARRYLENVFQSRGSVPFDIFALHPACGCPHFWYSRGGYEKYTAEFKITAIIHFYPSVFSAGTSELESYCMSGFRSEGFATIVGSYRNARRHRGRHCSWCNKSH